MADTDITQLQVSVGIVVSQVGELKKQQDRIEKKLDIMNYVPKDDFESYKKEVRETYVTQAEYRPFRALIVALLVAVASGVVGIFVNSFRVIK